MASKFSVAIQQDNYKKLVNDTLGDEATAKQFVADISTCVANNSALQNCEAGSVLSAGLVAQTLKLPLTPSLGFAYLVPYGNQCQFLIGWKGLVQLAQRSGQFERLGVRPVHEGEHIGQDEFGEDMFKFSHEFDSKPVIGYYAYFKLLNGFTKTIYWTTAQCEAHGTRYSQAHRGKNKGGDFDNWSNMFEIMAEKTVMKQLLSKYAPLSVDLQKAMIYDQAVINKDGTPNYVDTTDEPKSITTPNNVVVETPKVDK